MKTIIVFAFFMLFLSVLSKKNDVNYRYLITTPKTMYIDTTQKVCVTFENCMNNKTVTLFLKAFHHVTSISKNIPAGESGCLDLVVPGYFPATDGNLKIKIINDDTSEVEVEKSTKIKLNAKTLFILIQTDKPIYKPGQIVRIRILTMNSLLRPVLDQKTEAWIADPNNIKVAQWKDIDCPSGLCSLEMPLSEEPVLGKWNIFTKVGTAFNEQQSFEVQEYVLPKFEVTINPPPFIVADTDYFEIEICARYTYGKPVKGTLYANLSLEILYGASPVSYTEIGKIDGCKTIKIKSSYLELSSVKVTGQHINMLQIFAEVKEAETGIKINSTHPNIEIIRAPLNFKVSDYSKRYFKPGIPYYATVFVTKPDGTPAPNENIEIRIKDQSKHQSNQLFLKTFKSNSNGKISFTVPAMSPKIPYFIINIKSLDYLDKNYPNNQAIHWRKWMVQPQTTHVVKQWYSPSQSFVQIKPLPDTLDCNKQYPVTVFYTTEDLTAKIELYYQIMSRGAVILFNKTVHTFNLESSGIRIDESFLSRVNEGNNEEAYDDTIPPFVDSLTLDLTMISNMSPKSRLLVYFIVRHSNYSEIVADSQDFRMHNCLENEAVLSFNKTKILPGDKVRLELKATPDSLCAVGVIDKSVHILRSSNQLTKTRVFERLQEFEPPKDQIIKSKCGHFMDLYHDSSDYDVLITRVKRALLYPTTSDYVDSLEAFQDMGIATLTNIELETRPCNRVRYDTRGRYDPLYNNRGAYLMQSMPGPPDVMYRLTPNMEGPPGLDLSPLPTDHKTDLLVELRNFFPETWLWELQSFNDAGKCVIEREVPHSITTWIGSMFCISSSTGLGVSSTATLNAFQPFFISFNLPYSIIRGETVPISVSVFNYLPECIIVKLSLEKTNDFILKTKDFKKICLCGSESKVHRFVIQAKTLGFINITVHARTVDDRSICGNDVVISSEGKVRDSISQQLLIEAEGFPKEYTQSQLVCPAESPDGIFKQTLSLMLPDNVVNGSARAKITVIGDIMGPTLTGLDKLVQLPTGCGEQNMATLAPLVFVMQYLSTTNQIQPDLNAKAIGFLQSGYQRQSNYRHLDGSYSAFGKSDESGSLWLTAFVVKSFVQAKTMIPIDEGSLEKSIQYLKLQQTETGCFQNTGKVLQKELKGGLGSDNSVMLSAYILISLLESNVSVTDSSIQMGLSCITSVDLQDIYGLSLTAYALTLAGEYEKASTLLTKLEGLAKKSENLMYWEKDDHLSKSLSIEITAYNLLTYSNTINYNPENIVKALAIVRWLSQQRNPYGGFQSTQDTVVALQALATYASKTYNDDIDINMSVAATKFNHDFYITSVNRLVLQTQSIAVVPNTLEIIARGKGCALVQASMLYNVDGGKLLDEAFSLNVSVKDIKSGPDACKKKKMKICAKYMLPDGASNMAIIQVKLVTGYWPDKDNLKWSMPLNRDIKRYEIENRIINFYFDEITSQQICFSFHIEQYLEIKDAKPGSVQIYDYYDERKSKTVSYTIDRSTSGCHRVEAKPELAIDSMKVTLLPKPANKSDNSIQEAEYSSTNTEMITKVVTKRSVEDTDKVKYKEVLEDGSIAYILEPEYITLPTFDTSNLKRPEVTNDDEVVDLGAVDFDDIEASTVTNLGGGSVGDPEYHTLPTFDMKAHLKSKKPTASVGDPEYYTLPTFDIAAHLNKNKPTAFVGDPEYHTLPTFDMKAKLRSQQKSIDSEGDLESSTIQSYQMEEPDKNDFEDTDTVSEVGDPEYFTLPTFDPMSTCSVCLNKIPENLAEIYCSAVFAFKADVFGPMSLMLHSVLKPKIDYYPALISIKMNSFCTCDFKSIGKKVFVFGISNNTVENDLVKERELFLNENIYVIPLPSQENLSRISASC